MFGAGPKSKKAKHCRGFEYRAERIDMVKKCKRCKRKIRAGKNNPGYNFGYGPTCWVKYQEEQPKEQPSEIESLKAQVATLTLRVNQLLLGKAKPEPIENSHNGGSTVGLLKDDYSISELKTNPLFLKMQKISEVS